MASVAASGESVLQRLTDRRRLLTAGAAAAGAALTGSMLSQRSAQAQTSAVFVAETGIAVEALSSVHDFGFGGVNIGVLGVTGDGLVTKPTTTSQGSRGLGMSGPSSVKVSRCCSRSAARGIQLRRVCQNLLYQVCGAHQRIVHVADRLDRADSRNSDLRGLAKTGTRWLADVPKEGPR